MEITRLNKLVFLLDGIYCILYTNDCLEIICEMVVFFFFFFFRTCILDFVERFREIDVSRWNFHRGR